MEMINALARSSPKEVYRYDIDGIEFILECDIGAIEKGIESLKGKYGEARYGYQQYNGDLDIDITEEVYLGNIEEFMCEFKKRLGYDYAKEVIKKAKKKKNGTFHKGRVWDEYVLGNASNNGSGAENIYKVKYETVGDNVIRLVLHYTSEYIRY